LFLAAGAAELSFSAEVDRTALGLGEQLQLTVTVSGTNIGGVPRPELPALEGFNQLGSTSSQSTNISFVNGRMTQEQTISFIHLLEPKQTGTLTIGPCKLDFKGTVYQTQPIAVTVTRESRAPPPQQPPPGFQGRTQPRGSAGGNLHLAASADRNSVYQGEQVTVAYTLYTRVRLGNLSMKDVPGFTGFWAEKLYEAKDLNWRATTWNGQRYDAAPLKRVALFPTQSGDLKIDKMTLAGEAITSGGFFFNSSEPFEVSSDPLTVHVKPLPDTGRPADFSGGVGEFGLAASLNRDSSVGGEPLTLSVSVSGTGNVGLVGEPKPAPVTGVKILSPETKHETSTGDGKVGGTRRFNFPVIPAADGKHVVPEITMSFFNPKTATYYTRKTQPLSFVASGATGKVVLSETESGVKLLGSDINHIKLLLGPPPLFAGRCPPKVDWLFYPLGLVVLVAGVVLGRHRRKLENDRGYARKTRSSRMVRKGLAEATRLLAVGNERGFYAALNRAVIRYVGDRFNLETHGMTGEELRVRLAGLGVGSDTVDGLLDLIASCDTARFSPGMTRCSPRETLEKARAVLEAL
jgi:hypothetical protein